MRNVPALVKVELLKYARQPIVIGFGVAFPLAWVAINGMMSFGPPGSAEALFGGHKTLDFMFPAYIFMIALVSGLSSLPQMLAKNYEAKAIVRYGFTPITKTEYLLSLFVGNLAMVLLSTVAMFVLAWAAFGLMVPSAGNILLTLAVVVVSCFAVSALGVLIANVVPGFQATLSVSLFVYFVFLFISGAAIPLPVLPETLRTVTQFVPFTYAVSLLQDVWLGMWDHAGVDAAATLLMAAVFVMAAALTFRWAKT